MAEQATVFQLTQLGIEATATPGTKVATTKRLMSMSIVPSVKANVNTYTSSGYLFSGLAAEGQEWCEAKMEGGGNYNEIVYPLNSLLKDVTTTGAGDDKTWVFAPSSTSAEVIHTFTVEHGSAVRAGRFGYGIVNEFGMDITRDEVTVSGNMIGQLYEDGITMTAGNTEVTQMPMMPNECSIYVDTTAAGLGGTKLTRVLSASWKITDRYGPLWAIDAANTSWVTAVDLRPKGEVKLKMEADAVGMARLAKLRLGTSEFIRIAFVGASHIGTGVVHYDAKFDFCGKIEGISDFADQDGVYAIEYTYGIYHDPTWAKALSFTIVNAIPSLASA